ncbi:unnamed protein product [Enterobius vermicularis]|uniref:DUF1189 domain-containing protein n=1 Tax=Enterobius vermicularis TaxID=51028 RepID=A0A0N4V9P4_ENTVE|nr:unnamed protein product [Enterobius vermicularis]
MNTGILSVFEPIYDSTFKFSEFLSQRHNGTDVVLKKYETKETLLSFNLVLLYLKSQDRVFTLFCVISAIFALIVLISIVFCIGRFIFGKFGGHRYQAHPTKPCRFRILLTLFLIFWFIDFGFSVLFTYGTADFYTYKPVTSHYVSLKNITGKEIHGAFAANTSSTLKPTYNDNAEGTVLNRNSSVQLDSNSTEQADDLFEIVHEEYGQKIGGGTDNNEGVKTLSYRLTYYNLHEDVVYQLALISLVVVLPILLVYFVLSIFTIIIGSLCYYRSYHPIDRSALSNRMGLWTIRMTVFLIAVASLMVFLSDVTLVYAQLHSQLCPMVQQYVRF